MKKVLLVGDQKKPRMELMYLLLKEIGFTVGGANEEEAATKTELEVYDTVLIDMDSLKTDGIGLMKTIKSKPQYKDTHMIALSDKGDKKQFTDAGFSDYVPMPLQVEDFVKRMDTYKR